MNDLEKRAEQLANSYSKNPDSVSRREVIELITDTYLHAVTLFDEKKHAEKVFCRVSKRFTNSVNGKRKVQEQGDN